MLPATKGQKLPPKANSAQLGLTWGETKNMDKYLEWSLNYTLNFILILKFNFVRGLWIQFHIITSSISMLKETLNASWSAMFAALLDTFNESILEIEISYFWHPKNRSMWWARWHLTDLFNKSMDGMINIQRLIWIKILFENQYKI